MSDKKQEMFVRVAEKRVNKILAMIHSLQNFSNSLSYEYTDDQIEQIFSALQKELDDTHNVLKKRNKKIFSLRSDDVIGNG